MPSKNSIAFAGIRKYDLCPACSGQHRAHTWDNNCRKKKRTKQIIEKTVIEDNSTTYPVMMSDDKWEQFWERHDRAYYFAIRR